jgi:hypothetical protein
MADIHQLAQFWLTPPVNLWVFVIVGVLFWRSKRNVLICLCSGLIITYIQYTPLFAKELTNLQGKRILIHCEQKANKSSPPIKN